MDLFGIGISELLFILIIILLVAGPKDIANTARNLGRWLNRIYKSPNYQVIRRASQEIRNLPARLAREAHLEELEELKAAKKDLEAAANTIGQSAAKPFQAWVEDMSPARPTPARPDTPSTPAIASPPGEPNPPASPPAVHPAHHGAAQDGATKDGIPAGAPSPEQDPAAR